MGRATSPDLTRASIYAIRLNLINSKMKSINQKKPSEESRRENDKSIFSELAGFSFETFRILIISLIIIFSIRAYVMQPFFVSGKSMEPNFYDGDYLIVDEVSYRFENPQRGDVIIFRYPKNLSEFFIKRIVGLPGETIEIRDSRVIVYNSEHLEGMVIDENLYLPVTAMTAGNYFVELKNDEYYVLGDNRSYSSDSRVWGTLEKRFIVGKALLRAWPLDKFSVFEGIKY